MKRICIVLGLLLILCACEKQVPAVTTIAPETTAVGVTTVAPTTTAVTAGNDDGYDALYLSDVDFDAYRDQLTEEEYTALALYLPVLQGDKTFAWQSGWSDRAAQEVDIAGFHAGLWKGIENPSAELTPYGFTLFDIVGDDGLELILWVQDKGHHKLLLHHTQDRIYGIDYPVRWFSPVCYGLYAGSAGAAAGSYHALRFADGAFTHESIAEWDDNTETYSVNGEAVQKDAFYAWEQTLPTIPEKLILFEK
ncbi:MAG: hypothetical protein IJX64_03450 [Clostridia bacterium]|nr:hypothetical protein [Clostridia bacterium]